jgi:F-type H+-transporting ATPase subunit epsilon
MAETLDLEVDTPERQLVREQVSEVQLPGKDGYIGILPGHAPLVGQIGTGFLSYSVTGKQRYLAVDGGFLEILDDRVRVLADSAETAEQIDVERARAELRAAQERLTGADTDPAVALHDVARAQSRIDAAEKK